MNGSTIMERDQKPNFKQNVASRKLKMKDRSMNHEIRLTVYLIICNGNGS